VCYHTKFDNRHHVGQTVKQYGWA